MDRNPESKDARATQEPARRRLSQANEQSGASPDVQPTYSVEVIPSTEPPPITSAPIEAVTPAPAELDEQHFTILYGDTGYSYRSILGPYLVKSAENLPVLPEKSIQIYQ